MLTVNLSLYVPALNWLLRVQLLSHSYKITNTGTYLLRDSKWFTPTNFFDFVWPTQLSLPGPNFSTETACAMRCLLYRQTQLMFYTHYFHTVRYIYWSDMRNTWTLLSFMIKRSKIIESTWAVRLVFTLTLSDPCKQGQTHFFWSYEFLSNTTLGNNIKQE